MQNKHKQLRTYRITHDIPQKIKSLQIKKKVELAKIISWWN